MALHLDPESIDFSAWDLPARPRETGMLMGDPANVATPPTLTPEDRAYMQANGITVPAARRMLDGQTAQDEWRKIRDALIGFGLAVEVLNAPEGRPDFTFIAGHALAMERPDGVKMALMSRSMLPWRRDEETTTRAWFEANGILCADLDLPEGTSFGGGLNAILHPGRFLLYLGITPRTPPDIVDAIQEAMRDMQLPVVGIELADPRLPLLSRCVCPIDEKTVLFVPTAMSYRSAMCLRKLFRVMIKVPDTDAQNALALSAIVPSEGQVMMPAEAGPTAVLLRRSSITCHRTEAPAIIGSGHGISELAIPVP